MAPSPFLLVTQQVTQQVTKQVTLLGCRWENIDRRIAEILITGFRWFCVAGFGNALCIAFISVTQRVPKKWHHFSKNPQVCSISSSELMANVTSDHCAQSAKPRRSFKETKLPNYTIWSNAVLSQLRNKFLWSISYYLAAN